MHASIVVGNASAAAGESPRLKRFWKLRIVQLGISWNVNLKIS